MRTGALHAQMQVQAVETIEMQARNAADIKTLALLIEQKGGSTLRIDQAQRVVRARVPSAVVAELAAHALVQSVRLLNGRAPEGATTLTTGALTPTQLAGDGDASIEPGEDFLLSVALGNTSGVPVTAVTGTLSSSTTGVTVHRALSAYPDIAAGGSASNTTAFVFSVASTVPCGTPLSFSLLATYTGGTSPETFPLTLPSGAGGAVQSFSYAGPPVSITDSSGPEVPGPAADASLAVSGLSGVVADVDLRIDGATCSAVNGATTVGLDHTFVNDLALTLLAPGGTSVLLVSRTDGSGNNFCQTLLDDQSSGASIQAVASSDNPFSGSFKPNAPLSAFSGQSGNGTWTLRAVDNFIGDSGSIRAFSLLVSPAVCNAAAQAPVIAATKTVAGTFVAGTPVTYTVVLNNAGGILADLAADEFTDTLPAGLSLTSASASSGTATASGNVATWNGSLLPGAAVTITLNATINVGATGAISNQGTVHFDANRDGVSDSTGLTDDPGVAGAANPTVFTVAQGNLSISPASLAFGNQPLGSTSAAQTVTLANTGTAPLSVTALTAAAAPFDRTAGGTCAASLPITLANGASCTLTYTFAPTAIGAANQTLTVTADAPGSGTIALSGTGTQGTLSITPASIAFGNQPVGSTSAAQTVTLANTGSAPLNVTALTAASAPFVRTAGGTCATSLPITLSNGANCTLTYTFAPTAAGAASQTLTVTANAPGSGTIALSGSGTVGVPSLSASVLDFSRQLTGTTTVRTLSLSNTGTAALQVTAISAATAPFALAGGGTCSTVPFSLAPGGSCTLVYSFNSSLEGLFLQTLSFSTDFGALTVQLRGQAQSAVQLPATGSPARLFLLALLVVTGVMLVGTRRR